jgi:hypothetical protein
MAAGISPLRRRTAAVLHRLSSIGSQRMAGLLNQIKRMRSNLHIPLLKHAHGALGGLTTDQQLALKAVSDAQRVLEEYLEPRPHNPEGLLDRLVEILERPDIIVAVVNLLRIDGHL